MNKTYPFAKVQLYPGKNKAAKAQTVTLGDVDDPYKDASPLARDYLYGISAYQDGDNVYVTYRKAKTAFSDSEGMQDIASSLDLYEVTFDGRKFGTPVCINNEANTVLESAQVVYAENGEITIAWMENSENDIFLTSGTNSLHMCTLK